MSARKKKAPRPRGWGDFWAELEERHIAHARDLEGVHRTLKSFKAKLLRLESLPGGRMRLEASFPFAKPESPTAPRVLLEAREGQLLARLRDELAIGGFERPGKRAARVVRDDAAAAPAPRPTPESFGLVPLTSELLEVLH